ncbi:MAG: hypothetical protein KDK39_00695 [Leptospiraceae bacterium]|nr:hypothetical protein [Leptospiraceae bacterium]
MAGETRGAPDKGAIGQPNSEGRSAKQTRKAGPNPAVPVDSLAIPGTLQLSALSAAVSAVLQQNPTGLNLYDLLKKAKHMDLFPVAAQKRSLLLFRQQFILMHVLYDLALQGQADLRDSPVRIKPGDGRPAQQRSTNEHKQAAADTELSDPDPLHIMAAFYFNWDNYRATDADQVAAWLHSFWRFYQGRDKVSLALQTLGYQEHPGLEPLKRSYRALVHRHHPDKGGDPIFFLKIQQAWEVLRRTASNP